MAPKKPSVQSQFILEAMSKNSEDDNTRWNQVMGNFNMLFAQINDLGLIQQELKTEVTTAKEEQKKIVKQVQANG